MTWVKICGITNLEDALVAVEAGADAVGFVFYEKSPRCVSVETAREIVERLPERIEKVGVFVGGGPEAVAEVSRRGGLTIAQIYPCAPVALNDEFLMKVPCRVIAALSIGLIRENEMHGFHVSNEFRDRLVGALLDSGTAQFPGGTGKTFDWRKMANMMKGIGLRLIVAGGLIAQNVKEAIEVLQPWGVDVASGVEARPGKKDPEKVRAFVRAVREADRKTG